MLISEELLAKIVYVYEQAVNFDNVQDNEEETVQKDKASLMTNKKITFSIEGEETELWSEYIEGKQARDVQIQNRKARKITTQNTAFQNQYNTLRQ